MSRLVFVATESAPHNCRLRDRALLAHKDGGLAVIAMDEIAPRSHDLRWRRFAGTSQSQASSRE